MRVAIISDRVREETFGQYLKEACDELGVPSDNLCTFEPEAIGSEYDLYVHVDHGDYQASLPEHLRPKVFYAADTHLPKAWKSIREMAPRYDMMVCIEQRAAKALDNGVWVPIACAPKWHGKRSVDKQWDVAFVGTEGGVPRKFFLEALRERYPRSFIWRAPHSELGDIYSQARIGFNFSIRNEVNMRVFEVLCAGTLLVTNQVNTTEMRDMGLQAGRDYVQYLNPEEMFDRIDHFLAQPDEAEQIAASGHAVVHARHTYRHRMEQILQLAEERLGVTG